MQKDNVKFKIILLGILFFGIFGWAKSSWTEIISADRQVTWQGNVGVEGGIPARTTQIDCTQAPYNVPTDGISDCQPSITACLNGIASGQTAYLPAGKFIISWTLVIPSNKTLRGAGMNSTIIRTNVSVPYALISIGNTLSGAGWYDEIDIQSGYTKGSETLTFASSDAISTISVGDFVIIDELNDAAIPVTSVGLTGGTCAYCGRPGWDNPPGAGGARARGQSVRVTGKNGAQLTFTPSMFFTFSNGNSPQIAKWEDRPNQWTHAGLTKYAGVENLTLYNNGGDNIGLAVGTCSDCGVKGIKIEKAGSRVLVVGANAYRCEVRDSYFYDCNDHSNSDQCYGTAFGIGATGNLIENNIYNYVSEGPMVVVGASGNVIAYNYLYEVHRTANQDGVFWPDTWSHAAHPSFNLFEGNEMVGLNFDYYIGSGSHNVIFRTRILAKSQLGDSYYLNLALKGTHRTSGANRFFENFPAIYTKFTSSQTGKELFS